MGRFAGSVNTPRINQKDIVNGLIFFSPFQDGKQHITKNWRGTRYMNVRNLKEDKYDEINKPEHYTRCPIECIDVMTFIFGKTIVKAFCLCNAFKYLWRCMIKHKDPAVDIGKARWYLNKWLELNERSTDHGQDTELPG